MSSEYKSCETWVKYKTLPYFSVLEASSSKSLPVLLWKVIVQFLLRSASTATWMFSNFDRTEMVRHPNFSIWSCISQYKPLDFLYNPTKVATISVRKQRIKYSICGVFLCQHLNPNSIIKSKAIGFQILIKRKFECNQNHIKWQRGKVFSQ
jgi:hypothetical protein